MKVKTTCIKNKLKKIKAKIKQIFKQNSLLSQNKFHHNHHKKINLKHRKLDLLPQFKIIAILKKWMLFRTFSKKKIW